MNCPHCREYLPDTALECSYCGGRIVSENSIVSQQTPASSSSKDSSSTRKLWWSLIAASTGWLVVVVATCISLGESLSQEFVLWTFLGYLAFWVVCVCVWAFFLLRKKDRGTYFSALLFAVIAVAVWAYSQMHEREVEDIINAVFDDGTASFVDSDGNFDGGVYGRLESVTTMTTGWAETKEIIRGMIENEEKFARRFSELGEMVLDVGDYDDPPAINSIILELREYRELADEYENTTFAYLESHLGKKPDLEDPAPFSLDEKMAKLHALLNSMRRFADVSIETYGYLLSVQDQIGFGDDGNVVIESDEARERFNALADAQSSAAYDFDDEAQEFEAYSAEYLEHLRR